MKLALLRKSPLLSSLPLSKLAQLARIARVQDFSKGTMIFNKTDLASHMFIVVSGSVRIHTSQGGRKRKTFAYLGPGEFFGEMALLGSQERSASAEAVEETRLLVIHKRYFKRFLLADPVLGYKMLRTLSERLRDANEEIENLLFRNLLNRVGKTILDIARRRGRPHQNGLLIENIHNQREIADLVGTTREPLSRALAALRRAKLIRLQAGELFVPDIARLERL